MEGLGMMSDYEPTVIRCRCLLDCPDFSDNSTCVLPPKAKCYKKLVKNIEGDTEVHAGCLGSQDEYLDQCNPAAQPDFEYPTVLGCCNNGSMCNDFLDLKLDVDVDEDPLTKKTRDTVIVIGATIGLFMLLSATIIVLYRLRLRCQERRRREQIETENKHVGCPRLHGHNCRQCKHKGLGEIMDQWPLEGTSSGSGMPLLMQRTIANQIQIVEEIGRGRYGSVMLGTWREEKVALKIFNSTDEDSWYRETEIYQTVLLRHENVLGFIAADICGVNSCTKLYLITDYHERGSLHDFLQATVVGLSEALVLAHSASSGLAHLHTEITGTQGKPAIAHRDVKTKNILVKNDGQCCIADMGLAVRFSRPENKVDIGRHDRSRRQGTKRYMAPEVLTQNFNCDVFDAYKAADVYGFALVMWEIINRTLVNGKANEYRLPYHKVVGADPDFDEMKKVVALEGIRPDIQDRWLTHKVTSVYVHVMGECWSQRPESRLSMLRVRKSLFVLREDRSKPHKVALDSTSTSSDGDRKPSLSTTSSSSGTSPDRTSPIPVSTYTC